MDVIILAAGKGTRLKEITKEIPKSLVTIQGKPILEYTLSALPSSVKKILIVVGHLGDQIKNTLGEKFNNLEITYIEQKEQLGTADAVWLARPYLSGDKFLVLNGDDIYDKSELEEMIKNDWAFGLIKQIPPKSNYLTIELDENKDMTGARYPTEQEMTEGILMATGAYVLGPEIFDYKPVQIANGEYGLPQTILKLAERIKVKGYEMKNWIQINTPEDIAKAENMLK